MLHEWPQYLFVQVVEVVCMLSFAYALHAMYVCSMCRCAVYAPFTACELHGGLVIYAVCAVYAFVHYMNLAVRAIYVVCAICVVCDICSI